MAKLVLGLGTSHGPQLFFNPSNGNFAPLPIARTRNTGIAANLTITKPCLPRAEDQDFAPHLTPEAKRAHFERCQRAIGAIADAYKTAKPDVAVVIGNDQSEIFTDENIPAFSVFWGESIENYPRTPEELAKLTPGIAPAEIGYKPATRTSYACDPALGKHIIGSLVDLGFDVGQSKKLPIGPGNSNAAPMLSAMSSAA